MTDRLGPPPQDRYRLDLGAYLAGALEPEERAALELHLPTCRGCQAELGHLAPLPGLLRRLEPADLAVARDRPPPSLREGVLSAAAARRRAERRSLRMWRGAALAGLVAAAAVTAVLVVPAGSSPAPQLALEPVALSSARGTADIHVRPWGTQIILHLSGLPAGADCEAWVVTAAGRTPIGSWGPTASRLADIEVATSLRPGQLQLQVTTSTGRALLGYHV